MKKTLTILQTLLLGVALTMLFALQVTAQQVPDTTYRFSIRQAAYAPAKGPLILIDEAHHNFHTKAGGYSAFSKLLEQDGYSVKGLTQKITKEALNSCEILVIANALHAPYVHKWVLPNPSAFTAAEIAVLKEWVKGGGSLLLIADHMPFAGAARELASAFGFTFLNGFARKGDAFQPPLVFTEADKSLHKSPVTTGLQKYEMIDRVATFTGSAFTIPEGATPVLRFSDEHISLQPDTAWQFHKNTPVVHLNGYFQGAIHEFGKGKIAVFGEAAMFTAQVVNQKTRFGMNSDYAPQNAQFVLNLVHWLDGVKRFSGPVHKGK